MIDLEPYIYRPHPIFRLPSREDAAVDCKTQKVRRNFGRKFICKTSFNIQIRTRDLCTACAARQPWKILLYSSRTHHPHRELFQVCLIRLGFSGPRQLRLAGVLFLATANVLHLGLPLFGWSVAFAPASLRFHKQSPSVR